LDTIWLSEKYADQPNADPVLRLQLSQWQTALSIGSPSTWMELAPQQQMAVRVMVTS
jgi:hypothetical protein